MTATTDATLEQPEFQIRDRIYINGEWVASESSETLEVIDSVTESVMGTIPNGTAGDVDRAVQAAVAAFDSWSQTTAEERAGYLDAIAAGLRERRDDIAAVISRETGMVRFMSRRIQLGVPILTFSTAAQVTRDYAWETREANSLIVREPIGVVGCITPWNYPLNQIAAKIAYAFGAGCTVVLKPSEIAPLDAFMLTEIIESVGLPAGVFNLVSGDGPTVGEAIAAHPDVDMVSFTGSTRAGKRVAQVAAETVKRVTLELGGKSANVLLDDLSEEKFAEAVRDGVTKAFYNSGQTCIALTRMLVPSERLEEAESLAADAVEAIVVGNPFDDRSELGPLASQAQQSRVQNYIQLGLDENAKLVTGGLGVPEGLDQGFYVRPTVFSNVTTDMTIAQEEIFGPVLSILPYETEDEAVTIANDVIYGLSGGVWAEDADRGLAVARRIRTGQIEVNGGPVNLTAPLGGYKQSGLGRENGVLGFEEFLEVKSIQLQP